MLKSFHLLCISIVSLFYFPILKDGPCVHFMKTCSFVKLNLLNQFIYLLKHKLQHAWKFNGNFAEKIFTSLINHQHNFKIRKKDFTKTKFQTNFVGFETVGALESPKVTAKLDTIWKQLAQHIFNRLLWKHSIAIFGVQTLRK